MLKSSTSFQNVRLKVAILCISLTIQTAGAVAAAVPAMIDSFANRSTTEIQSLLTIPSFSIMLFIILSSGIIKYIGKRNTVLIGLTIALLGGLLPSFTSNFYLILLGRFLFGAGTGLYNSLTISLIGDCFEGDEQQNLIGLQSATAALGNSVATFMAGLLLSVNWHSSFLVYLAIIPMIIIFSLGYTKRIEKETSVEVKNDTVAHVNKKLSPAVLLGIFTLFFFFVSVIVMLTSSALAIQQLGLAHSELLSLALAVSGILGSISFIFYGQIHKLFKNFTPVLACILGFIGYLILLAAPNMLVFFIGLVFVSVSMIVIPYVYGLILSSVAASAKNIVISLAMIACNLGSFFSPFIISFLGKIFGASDALSQIKYTAFIFVVIALIFTFSALTSKNKGREQ